MPQDHHAQKPTPELQVEGLEKELKGLRRSFLIGAIGGGGLLVGALVVLSERFGRIIDLFDRTPVSQAPVVVTSHHPIVLAASDFQQKSAGKIVQRITVKEITDASSVAISASVLGLNPIDVAVGSTIDVLMPLGNEVELRATPPLGDPKSLKLALTPGDSSETEVFLPEVTSSTYKTGQHVTTVKLDFQTHAARFYVVKK